MKLFDNVRDLVVWPDSNASKEKLAERLLKTIRRMIDFDGTIVRKGTQEPSATLCGQPLADFLADEPYVVQTFNPTAARLFFERNPHLPKPVMIIVAPVLIFDSRLGIDDVGKDFSCLGLENKHIIDDLDARAILAPGCLISPP